MRWGASPGPLLSTAAAASQPASQPGCCLAPALQPVTPIERCLSLAVLPPRLSEAWRTWLVVPLRLYSVLVIHTVNACSYQVGCLPLGAGRGDSGSAEAGARSASCAPDSWQASGEAPHPPRTLLAPHLLHMRSPRWSACSSG